MGVAAYRVVGPYYVPPQRRAVQLFWRQVHRPLRRRGFWLGRLAAGLPALGPAPFTLLHRPQRRLEWAASVEQRLAARLGPRLDCVWRPAAPGVSRAALGWVGREQRLLALARVAFGPQRAFLVRQVRALTFLAALPELNHTMPRLLWTEEDAASERLLAVESACAGEPASAATLARRDWLGAAAWLAHWQTLTPASVSPGSAERWRQPLQQAIAAHGGLAPAVRRQLLRRLEGVRVLTLVAAHGDFWWGNLLWRERSLAVVDWTEFRMAEHPLHDAGFFLLTLGRDLLASHFRLDPAVWLERAFAPGAPFRCWAEAWFEHYRVRLLARLREGLDFSALLEHLPLVMARYACFGQQAPAWTAACNAWPLR